MGQHQGLGDAHLAVRTRPGAAPPPGPPVRRVRRLRRRLEAAGRAVHRARRAREFSWWRARMLGGRTNHWGRISLRFGPDDFRRKSHRRPGRRLADQLRRHEAVLRRGRRADRHLRQRTKDCPIIPTASSCRRPAPRCYELLVKKASDKLKVTCIPSRLSILTQPLNGRAGVPLLRPVQSRLHGQGQLLLAPTCSSRRRCATGKLTLITNAMAREVTVGTDGLRRRRVVHRQEHRRRTSRCAPRSSCSPPAPASPPASCSTRKSAEFPQGLGQLERRGRQVPHRHHRHRRRRASFPTWWITSRHNDDGVGGVHVYMPWWLDNKKLDFPRGYHIEIWGGLGQPAYGFMGGIQNYPARRRLRQGAQGRLSQVLRRRRSASPAAAR